MAIPLKEFELHIRPEPLERGLSLYELGQMELLRNAGGGRVEAVVHDAGGSFHPVLMVEKDAVVKTNCDCGQLADGICRHVVAVMFGMSMGDFKEGVVTRSGKMPVEKAPSKRLHLPEGKPKAAAKEKPTKAPKAPKTVADLLEILPKEEIVKFLVDLCKSDRQLSLRVKSHFGDLLPLENPVDLAKRIEEAFKAVGKVKGRFLKSQMELVDKSGNHWLDECIRFAQLSQLDMACEGLKVAFQHMAPFLNERDFPADKRSSLLLKIRQLIDEIAKAGKGKPEMSIVVSTFVSMSAYLTFDGELYFLKVASEHCTAPDDVALVKTELVARETQPGSGEYGLHYNMIKRLEGEAAAGEFRKKHADNVYFTTLSIHELIVAKAYDKALALIDAKLSKDGQKAYKHHVPIIHWFNLRDLVYKASSNLQARLLNRLDIQILDYHGHKPSIQSLADLCSPSDWANLRSKVLPMLNKLPYDSYPLFILEMFAVKNDKKPFSEYLDGMSFKQLATFGYAVTYKADEAHFEFVKLLCGKLWEGLEHHASNRLGIDKYQCNDLAACFRHVWGASPFKTRLEQLIADFPNFQPLHDIKARIW